MSANPAKLTIVPPATSIPPPAKEHWFSRGKDGSLTFNGQTYEDHVGAWDDAQNAVDAGLWGQSMVAASLVTKYGESDVKRFASDVKRSAVWIYDMARAYRVFGQKQSQLYYLSFTHHVEAAKAAKDDDTAPAVEALNKAHDKEWNTKELQEYVATGIEPEPKTRGQKQKPGPELQRVRETAIQNELTAKVAIVREWPEQTVDPLLGAVYRRIASMLEWQKNRTIERDCLAVMEVFSNEEGYTAPDCASFAYIQAWLNRRGWMMKKTEITATVDALKTLHMLTDNSRKGSKGSTQRGVVTPVYDPCLDYAEKMEEFATMNPTDRRIALHLDWVQRVRQYAPHLLETKQQKAA